MASLPRMIRIRQEFPRPTIPDLASTMNGELARLRALTAMKAGARVAVAVGSRAILDIDKVTKIVCGYLSDMGTRPFIVPAMGSHGNATAHGQAQILSSLGITERTMGVPIHSSIETTQLGVTPEGIPVYIDKNAFEADAVLLINRIKPHTDFQGKIGSGLMKMMTIGLGKPRGAAECHAAATRYGHEHTIRTIARFTLATGHICAGIGLVENAYHELARVVCLPAGEIEDVEMTLLEEARRLMPRLPFDPVDLLIIDEMGKNISGTGIDPNITGRCMNGALIEQTKPVVRRILVRDLTPESLGNAVGIGLADFTTKRLVDKIDFEATYTNCLTALATANARLPIIFGTDRQAVEAAVTAALPYQSVAARVLRIKNTLVLDDLLVSEAFATELRERHDLTIVGPPHALPFDTAGNLIST
ncbi:MAG: DUF2088 domain-containing protein [Acidobacteria bacterium]|nr:DUF2088 domain-containing protein [Acidobacteriota bacterium]MBI3654790.1 DUF2088 domain-containing protein [Acidobacteriota bacterium]